ncbi:nucleoside hydrolase [Dysgonomonas sp. Marseille-P4677]|uniref:nucleoside hydrolase n=1 Tax=Dysgonomonas sp. Marseille-P4677 TaxID=2364790 RepID=UPI0019142D7D|nr:nucleoside hydrolase [Dysgonomonas sp. Marseille-P4677]MBK5722361.1 nucleoside hydrolase [Dysgonomonas sp. Marseille-P4677]
MKKLIYIISAIFFCAPCIGTTKGSLPVDTNIEAEKDVKKVKMILDLDTGIDDALALAYALADPKIELIGIVTSYGNVTTELSAINSLNILNLLHKKEIPVYLGADKAMDKTEEFVVFAGSKRIHGANGVGDVEIAKSPRPVEKQSGVDFMIESAKKYGKDLYIVAVGPTTNLTEAIRKEPNLKDMVGKFVIMGGALIVKGNVSPIAEANIRQDPAAANELFRSGTPLTMVGLDVTLRTLLTKKETQVWRDLGTTSGKIFADMVDFYIEAYISGTHKLQGCGLHDPLAVAVAVHPELVKTLNLHMQVGVTEKDWARTVAITEKMNDPNPNVAVCVDVEVEQFLNLFMDNLTQLFKAN